MDAVGCGSVCPVVLSTRPPRREGHPRWREGHPRWHARVCTVELPPRGRGKPGCRSTDPTASGRRPSQVPSSPDDRTRRVHRLGPVRAPGRGDSTAQRRRRTTTRDLVTERPGHCARAPGGMPADRTSSTPCSLISPKASRIARPTSSRFSQPRCEGTPPTRSASSTLPHRSTACRGPTRCAQHRSTGGRPARGKWRTATAAHRHLRSAQAAAPAIHTPINQQLGSVSRGRHWAAWRTGLRFRARARTVWPTCTRP